MKHSGILLRSIVLLSCIFVGGALYSVTVVSPDGSIEFDLTNSPDLSYRVRANDEVVLAESVIRIQLDGGIVLGSDVAFRAIERRSLDDTWQPVVAGRRSSIRNHYNELTLSVTERSPDSPESITLDFKLVVRVFNDGIAFRYLIPSPVDSPLSIVEESTQFRFSENWTCWATDHKEMHSSQENPFIKQSITDLQSRSLIGMPLVVKTGQHYLAITEADLENFAGMFLKSLGQSELSSSAQGVVSTLARTENQSFAVVSTGTIVSPWRVVMVAEKAPDLLHNDIILNLNDPCAIEDTSWIQPGMMAWDHWWSGEVQMDTATIKEYIQLAADMNWEYQLIDWQWYGAYNSVDADMTTVNPAVDMDEVRRFAKEKGVKLWLWMYWTDVDRQDAYLEAMELYESWGIVGIKIDFMDREDQWMVDWYHKIVKAAAKHHLMVDFHGAYKPTGWRRTYPNLMTREGILGNEYSKWSNSVTPEHNCTILYTRNLLGEMDFTPGGFLNRNREEFQCASESGNPAEVYGTRAHQLGLFVMYESPITCVCDHPNHIRNQPGSDFLKRVPTVWDQTIGLDGEIGEFAVVAKQSGEVWYVAAITDWNERILQLNLGFLPAGSFQMEIWQDGENIAEDATSLSTNSIEVNATESIPLNLASGGGVVMIFTPIF